MSIQIAPRMSGWPRSMGTKSGLARDGEDDRGEPDLPIEGRAGRVLAAGRGQGEKDRQDHRVRRRRSAARADRVSSDISDIIKRHPVELAALLRTTKGLKAEDIARLATDAQKAKNK